MVDSGQSSVHSELRIFRHVPQASILPPESPTISTDIHRISQQVRLCLIFERFLAPTFKASLNRLCPLQSVRMEEPEKPKLILRRWQSYALPPVRRWHRLVEPFQFHHVLERERMLGTRGGTWRRRLSENQAGKNQSENDKEFHEPIFYSVMSTEVETSLSIPETVRDFSTSLEMTKDRLRHLSFCHAFRD
jgi:hypothetical protein